MRIGELLLEQGLLSAEALDRALREQAKAPTGNRLGAILIRQGAVSETSLLSALAHQLTLPLWTPGSAVSDDLLASALETQRQGKGLPLALAQRWQAFLAMSKDQVHLVARDPLLPELLDHLERLYPGQAVHSHLASAAALEQALKQLAAATGVGGSEVRKGGFGASLLELAQDAPIVEFVASMLAKGTDQQASDIHLEPTETGFLVRYRVDGVLKANESHGRERFDAVVSRIKLVAGLDIAERRLPQDGRFSTRAAGIETEVRVSVIPGVHGESIVMRLLPKSAARRFRLEALGFAPDHLAALQEALQQPDGIILVTGPTGSGKSTTLYAALASVDAASTRVLTVEDPVEYQLPGITQFQVQTDIGFTFPAALRSILRHDPDTIMIGEIRDPETAAIAIQASLTGHKVLSTLHTNDAPSAFVRLIDIGVEPFLLAASVRTVIAQRLLRQLCTECKHPLAPSELPGFARRLATRLQLSSTDYQGMQPVGCTHCDGSGYRGRSGVHEVLTVTPELRHALTGGSLSDAEVRRHAPTGFRTLQEDAMLRFWQGSTSLAEVAALGPVDAS